MGRAHTIMKQYGLTLTKAIFSDVFNLNSKTVLDKIVLLTLRAIFNDYIIKLYGNQGYATMLLGF